MNFHTRT